MHKFCKILGVEKLGGTNYSKYFCVVFSKTGILFFDSFIVDETIRSYALGEYLKVSWSKTSSKYRFYPLDTSSSEISLIWHEIFEGLIKG